MKRQKKKVDAGGPVPKVWMLWSFENCRALGVEQDHITGERYHSEVDDNPPARSENQSHDGADTHGDAFLLSCYRQQGMPRIRK